LKFAGEAEHWSCELFSLPRASMLPVRIQLHTDL
jgi:hypothetical protein